MALRSDLPRLQRYGIPADDRGRRSRRCRGTASSHVCGRAAAFYAGSLRNCIPAEAGVALMSISVIRAAFECYGRGNPFQVAIEPSTQNKSEKRRVGKE